MDEYALRVALEGMPLGGLRYAASTTSTNDDAARWMEEGAPDLALVLADEQTAGRGRMGRRWWTPAGTALAFSLALRPPGSGPAPFNPTRLSALGGMAVCLALEEGYGLSAQVKWPNDVLIGGCKTAGVLAEAHWQGERLQAAILGIGVNVTSGAVPPASELLFPATCVEAESGEAVDRLHLLRLILERLIAWRPKLETQEFLAAWEERLAYRGELVRISASAGAQEGRLAGLNDDGSLRLISESGELRIYAGDLSLRPLH